MIGSSHILQNLKSMDAATSIMNSQKFFEQIDRSRSIAEIMNRAFAQSHTSTFQSVMDQHRAIMDSHKMAVAAIDTARTLNRFNEIIKPQLAMIDSFQKTIEATKANFASIMRPSFQDFIEQEVARVKHYHDMGKYLRPFHNFDADRFSSMSKTFSEAISQVLENIENLSPEEELQEAELSGEIALELEPLIEEFDNCPNSEMARKTTLLNDIIVRCVELIAKYPGHQIAFLFLLTHAGKVLWDLSKGFFWIYVGYQIQQSQQLCDCKLRPADAVQLTRETMIELEFAEQLQQTQIVNHLPTYATDDSGNRVARLIPGDMVEVLNAAGKYRFVIWFDASQGEFFEGWVLSKYLSKAK